MTPDVTNFTNLFQANSLILIFKVLILLLIFVFIIFNVIVVNRVRTLNKTLYLHAGNASALVYLASIGVLLASISLFIITLVIV